MNYLSEILAFNKLVEYNPTITRSDICLWHALMSIANYFGWAKEFSVSISTIMLKSRLSRNSIYNSRNRLKQLGLIDFKKNGGSQSATYKMKTIASSKKKKDAVEIVVNNQVQNNMQCEPQIEEKNEPKGEIENNFVSNNGTQNSTQHETQPGTQTGTLYPYIYKYKTKTKTKKENIANAIQKKVRWGEYKNVLLTEKEFRKLEDEYGDEVFDIVGHLDSYIEMKGYKAKSHYLAIKKWVVLAYREHKEREMRLNRGFGGGFYAMQRPQRELCTDYPE